jgi:hypothetical protein
MAKRGKTQRAMMQMLAVMLAASFLLAAAAFVWPQPTKAWSTYWECWTYCESSVKKCEYCEEMICPDGCSPGGCCFRSGAWRTSCRSVAHCP